MDNDSRVITQDEVTPCWPSLERLAPCQQACPLGTDVPGYVMALARGNTERALEVLSANNPLPSICGRVCHHPCEENCLRGHFDEPISIRALKRFVTENAHGTGPSTPAETKTPRQQVAVIGAGPAGLAAAHRLLSAGYRVTIFESRPDAGGMLTAGIPEFILPRDVVRAEIEAILEMGAELRTGVTFGRDITLDSLTAQGYAAVFLAVGAQRSASLPLPGIELSGVRHALAVLETANSAGQKLELKGRVVVIGGGNVGIDCARVAIRAGASEVHLVCLECREEMPAFDWEITRAMEEGVVLHPAFGPAEFLGTDGTVSGVSLRQVAEIATTADGRIKPVYTADPPVIMPAEAVIVAVGQAPEKEFIAGATGLAVDSRGYIITDPETLATNLPGVYAGGDIVCLDTAVTAIAAGRRAAAAINAYLQPDAARQTTRKQPILLTAADLVLPEFVTHRARAKLRQRNLKQRVSTFSEVDLGLTEKAAAAEASRCWNCPVCGKCILERSQMCYETALRLLR
jgi:NADPH-dependent glutamate synthase beta subunit-like oxidoreductase